MTAEVTFKDYRWSCEPIVVSPESQVIESNEHYKVVEYTVKVSVLRCYYKNEERIKEK